MSPEDKNDIPDPLGSIRISEDVAFDLFLTGERYDDISTAIAQGRYANPISFQLLSDLIPEPGNVLDLGAHIGTFALFAAALGHSVVAVEPSPRNASLLQASIRRNGFGKLSVVQAAVSDRSGTLAFVPAGPFGLVANSVTSTPSVIVPSVTGDELIANAGWNHIDFIKMDIEGSEVAALQGMPDLLSQADAPVILYESNGYTLGLFGQTPQQLTEALERFGYNCYVIRGHQLVPVTSSDPQPECNVDCVASKRPIGHPSWPVAPPATKEETVAQFLASCADAHKHVREYAARAMSQTQVTSLLDDARIVAALDELKSDPEPAVRAAAAWR